MEKVIYDLANRSHHIIPVREGDFVKDGLWHCGICKSPKQYKKDMDGFTINAMCLCKCEAEKLRKEEEEDRRYRRDRDAKRKEVGRRESEFGAVRRENVKRTRQRKRQGKGKTAEDREGQPLSAAKARALAYRRFILLSMVRIIIPRTEEKDKSESRKRGLLFPADLL